MDMVENSYEQCIKTFALLQDCAGVQKQTFVDGIFYCTFKFAGQIKFNFDEVG